MKGLYNCISELIQYTYSASIKLFLFVRIFPLNFSFYLNCYNYIFYFLGETFSGRSRDFLGPVVPWSDTFSTPATSCKISPHASIPKSLWTLCFSDVVHFPCEFTTWNINKLLHVKTYSINMLTRSCMYVQRI